MSATSIPPRPLAAAPAWNRPHPNSGSASPFPTGSPQPINGGGAVNGNGVNGNGIGHSRKGSLMVGGGMDIQRGNLAFGTVDSPNPLLSSSPAAPSITGTHLADNVKSFGSIEADSTDPNSVKPPSRRSSTLVSPLSPQSAQQQLKKQPDLHAMFQGKPHSQERRQSMNGPQGQFRPGPGQGPSPVMNPAMPMPFRPMHQQQQQQQMRPPNGMQQMQMRPQMMGPYGMQPQQYMYQQQFYPGAYDQQPQYNVQYQQWAPQQHPQNIMAARPMQSPGAAPQQQPNGLPNSGGPSPMPTPPSRPPSLQPLPSTPSRQPPSFSPASGSSFSMSGGAASFTPRTSKAIKIARADGTEVDIKNIAPGKPAPSSVSSSGLATPETPAATESPAAALPKKPAFTLPVVVRIESEEQKKQRMKEEADREKIRAIEKQEEKERKERKERQAREAEAAKEAAAAKEIEAKEAADKEAADKEAQAKADEEVKAKEAEEAKAKEAEEAKAKEAEAAAKAKEEEEAKKAEAEAAEKKRAEEAAAVPKEQAAPATPATATAEETPAASPQPDLPAKPSSSSGLSSAKPIDDLSSITYPSNFNPPSPRLNTNSEPGKFRYDRDFLMQFMQVCKEKPEDLPPLEDIGLEADTSSGFGARGGARGSRQAQRGAPSGLGIGGIGRPAQGMGAFGMGNFGAPGTLRGTTSEDRFQRSSSQAGRPGGRAPSSGLPPMASSNSLRGGARSQRGVRRPPPAPIEPDVAPLAVSSNSWVKARPTDNDESSPAYVERKVKSLLNKLTKEKFESISKQILEWANRSKNETDGMSLKLVIKLVFEKATDEAHWSEMYARLCRLLLDKLDPEVTDVIDGQPASGGSLFRKYLIGRCQMDFESGWKAREMAVTAAAAKSQEDKERLALAEQDKESGKEGEAVMLSDEYYAAQKAKRRGLGLVQLIGELYKLEMISTKVIRNCLIKLLANLTEPDEEDVESTVKLLQTVGGQFEAQSAESMNHVMHRLDMIANLEHTPSRIKFMIMDMVDLRRNKWQSKKTGGVMTIAEIHAQAAKEQAQKAAQAAQSTRESMSRGGSRAGRSRQDEWQQTPARLPQRPIDTSKLGSLSSSGAAPSFAAPTSIFGRKGKASVVTPPMSRQPSSANMFNVLNDEPERKKLNLAPRTVPLEGDAEGEGEGEAEADAEAEEPEAEEPEAEASGPMSEEAAKTKIASDMKELWGEKDQGGSRNPDDIVEYYKALPEERQPLLSLQLIDDVFRIAKPKDAEVVAKGLKAALEQNVASLDILKKGVETHMVSLDDDSIDFPQAYRAIALFMRSLSLSDEDIASLIAQVDVYGTPKITPKDKLDKALATLDAESA